MCEPTTIAAGVMAVTSAASAYGQYQTAEAQAEYQNERYEQNKKNANEALAQKYGDIGARQQQEQEAAAQRREDLSREAAAKRATSRVAAGEAGISGNSVAQALGDISGAAARDRSNVNANLDWTLGQLQRQKQSARTQTKGQINSVQQGQKPSKAALGVNLANTAASSYMQYDSVAPKTGKTLKTGKSLKGQGGFGSQVQTGRGGY